MGKNRNEQDFSSFISARTLISPHLEHAMLNFPDVNIYLFGAKSCAFVRLFLGFVVLRDNHP